MSIPVDLDELAGALAGYGYGYLMTPGADGRPHVVAVTPRLQDGRLHVEEPGRRTRGNAAARPAVALVFPPADAGGYSLIVDGDATVQGEALAITPTSAVRHRTRSATAASASPASAASDPAASPTGCGSDCRPVGG